MKVEHYVCEGCNECLEDSIDAYESHIQECDWYEFDKHGSSDKKIKKLST
jgi:hypothetical protein